MNISIKSDAFRAFSINKYAVIGPYSDYTVSVFSNRKATTPVIADNYSVDDLFQRFTTHVERDNKDGIGFIPGRTPFRNNKSMSSLSALVIDVDGNQSLDDVRGILEGLNYASILYTTYNHLQSETLIKVDVFENYCEQKNKSSAPSIENMVAYLSSVGKDYLNNITVDGERVTVDGKEHYTVQHNPLEKMRIVFPLRAPFVFSEHDEDAHAKEETLWSMIYKEVCRDLGFDFDESCADPSRMYYAPSHPVGADHVLETFGNVNTLLNLAEHHSLTLQDVKEYEQRRFSGTIKRSDTNRKFDFKGLGVKPTIWAMIYGKSFSIISALESCYPEILTTPAFRGKGVHLRECPFEAEHTSPPGTRTAILDGDGEEGFKITCQGNACKSANGGTGRDRLEYIEKMLKDGWLTIEALQSTGFGGGKADPLARAKNTTEETTPEELESIMREAVLVNKEIVIASTKKALKTKTKMPMGSLDKIEKEQRNIKSEEHDSGISRSEQIIRNRYKFIQNANGYFDMSLKEIASAISVERSIYNKINCIDTTPEERIKHILLGDDSIKYDKMCYRPGNDKLTIREMVNEHEDNNQAIRLLNTWRPSELEPLEGDQGLILELVNHFFEGFSTEKDYFLDTLAHLVQYPGIKQTHGIVLISDPGAGKGTFFEAMKKIVGEHNFISPGNEELRSGSFSFLENVQLCVVGETMVGDNRQAANNMKDLITEPEIRVIRKYVNTYKIENPALIVLCSNYDNPVYIEKKDRRYFVHRIKSKNKSMEFFEALRDEIDGDGAAIFLHYLLKRDLSKYDPFAPPMMTAAKRAIMESSQGETFNALQELFDTREFPFNRDVIKLQETLKDLKREYPALKQNLLVRFINDNAGGKLDDNAISYTEYDKNGKATGTKDARLWALRNLEHWKQVVADKDKDQLGKVLQMDQFEKVRVSEHVR